MRKFTFLALLITTVFTLGSSRAGFGQLLLEENFSYPAGDLITAHGWTAHSGTTQPITVSTSGLTFPGYIASGIGNAALLDNTGEDDSRVFTAQSSGVVYTAFMVNITTPALGYFFHLGGDPIGTTFRAKVFMDATNHFGLSLGSNTGTFAASTFTPGTTYLLVLKYEIVSGTLNDIVTLFVFDSAIPSSEPATAAVGPLTDATSSDINPGSVALRQYSATQNLIVDGIRTGMSWADILPGAIATPTIQAHDINFSGITSSAITPSWTNGDGEKRIVLINTTNSFTSPTDGTDPAANPVYSGTGEQVVYNGNGNTVSVTGLSGNTNYWFRVFEYNGAGSTTKYLTSTAVLNPNNQSTSSVISAPEISLPAYSAISTSSAVLGGTITSDGGTALLERGTLWNTLPGVALGDHQLAEGGLGTGLFSHVRTGMPAQTQIYFKAYATNSSGTSLTGESSFFTFSNEPATHVTGFNAIAGGNNLINLSWATPSTGATGYLILQRIGGAAPTGIPADGIAYTQGNVIGDGTVAAVIAPGAALNTAITGLSAGTEYTFAIIPFAEDGANSATTNYLTSPIIPTATATTTGSTSVTYTWQGADNGSWAIAGNWNPSRTTPAPGDILVFNDGTVKTVTGFATQTIAKMIFANNTTVNLQSPATATLTITGASGPDLEIPSGCALNLNAVNAISISVATIATASISGSIKFSSTASTGHRLTAADPGAIVFNNGATFTAGTFFSGNPFGTSSYGSVIFASGSTYLQQAGSNPFGAGQPNSVVVFQTGSLFKVMANLSPSFSGRTYANFEMDAPGVTLSPTGTSAVAIDNLTITNGTFNFNMTGPSSGMHQVKGDILVSSGGILNFNPASASTLSLAGPTTQSITINGSFSTNANLTLEISNSAGINLNSAITLNGDLELTTGHLSLGGANLTLSPTSMILGTPSNTAMVVATGSGQLRKGFISGFTGSFVFPVGDNTATAEYSPVTLDFASGTFATGNYAGVNLANAKYPTDPNTNSYLNRYWNLSSNGITAFSCNATLQYLTADVAGTEIEIFTMQVVPTPFTDFGLVQSGQHLLYAPGLAAFGTFTGSQPLPSVITNPASVIGANTATLNGEVIAKYNPSSVSFEYGTTTAYGTTVTGQPPVVNGGGTSTALANITGLTQNTTYHFRIFATNVQGTSYGNDLTFTTTCPSPSGAGTISGPVNVCRNGSGYVYTVPAIQYATSYTWNLPAGATITAGANTNSITVSFSAVAVSGDITVFGTSVCGSGSVSAPLNIAIIPQPVPTVAGPASACINSSGNVYTTEAGMTGYTWTVSAGGTITSGAATNSITVNWSTIGTQTITVSYTSTAGCTPAAPTVFPVSVVALPTPTIAGPATVCANAANIVYTTEAGMSNYNWAVSIGGTILSGAGTNAITVSWPYAGNRMVSVTYTNPTGCVATIPTIYNVTVNPAAVPTIGSSNDPCINSTNNQYLTNTGMSNYTWNISAGGTITAGQGTSMINVTWNSVGAQWVNVSYTNSYGCTTVTPTVYGLFVNPLPNPAGPVTGTASLCAGSNGVAYSCNEIMNATNYLWNLPAGATIASGAGTRDITVNFAANAVSGNISVTGNNSCGNGQASPLFSVAVNPVPPTPVVTAVGALLTSSAPSGNQWYFEGNAIPGATGKNYTATLSGNYWCIVTLNGCSSAISNKINVTITGQAELQHFTVNLFPVPNDGKFTLDIGTTVAGDFSVRIFNLLGETIYENRKLEISSRYTLQVDLGIVPAGMYTVELNNGKTKVIRKLMITK